HLMSIFSPKRGERSMRKSATTIAGLVALLAAALPAAPAHAFSAVTYVATNGSDGNPCTHALPCATINVALNVTPDGAVVRCIDPGTDFTFQTTVPITRSVTIDCSGVNGAMVRTGALGFVINAPGAAVTLRGLSITSLTDTTGGNFPGGPGAIGVDILAAARVTIQDCVIRGFSAHTPPGIRFAPSGFSTLTVIDSVFADNGLGIFVLPGSNGAYVSLKNTQMFNNAFGGFRASGAFGPVFGTILDSSAHSNGSHGLVATTP